MIKNRLRRAPAACAVALALAVSGSSGVFAGEQADRALMAVKGLIAAGELRRDAVLKVAFKPGNINSLLGPELELQREWEKSTGIMISAHVVPQQPALANLKVSPDIDLTVARNHEFPDLLDQGIIVDLAPYLKEFGFSLPGNPPEGYISPRLQSFVGDRIVAIPADGDVAILYLRRDLLEDPAERAAFRKSFGRDPGIPRTWQEYEQLMGFFHRPEQGMYGAAEERDPAGGWMYWLPRYFSQAAPYRKLFDDGMRPLIDSPAGVAATESYVRTVRFSPPEILAEGKDYSYTLPIFMQGKAFSTVFTIAAAKLFNLPGSAVRGKFVAIPMPGHMVGGKLIRHNLPIYGNNLVVSRHSPQRKLAFLFAMWLTDTDLSLRTVGVNGGHTDPYRWNHLKDRRIGDLYTPYALATFAGEWEVALPAGTGVPGDGEYLGALDQNLWLAARGDLSSAEAMRRTATEWEKITERRGRDKQIQALRAFNATVSLKEPIPGR